MLSSVGYDAPILNKSMNAGFRVSGTLLNKS